MKPYSTTRTQVNLFLNTVSLDLVDRWSRLMAQVPARISGIVLVLSAIERAEVFRLEN